jgi:TolB-like protein
MICAISDMRLPFAIQLRQSLSLGLNLTATAGIGSSIQRRAYPPVQHDARLTIAVLPFANVGDDEGGDWLGDGIAEDIMTAVSRFHDLTVIARNSSFRFRDAADHPQMVGAS